METGLLHYIFCSLAALTRHVAVSKGDSFRLTLHLRLLSAPGRGGWPVTRMHTLHDSSEVQMSETGTVDEVRALTLGRAIHPCRGRHTRADGHTTHTYTCATVCPGTLHKTVYDWSAPGLYDVPARFPDLHNPDTCITSISSASAHLYWAISDQRVSIHNINDNWRHGVHLSDLFAHYFFLHIKIKVLKYVQSTLRTGTSDNRAQCAPWKYTPDHNLQFNRQLTKNTHTNKNTLQFGTIRILVNKIHVVQRGQLMNNHLYHFT